MLCCAMLNARGDPGVRSLFGRTVRLIAIPCLFFILLTTLFARPIAIYAHVGSTIPILILGFSIALIWQVAIPRGILQGLPRFTSLSLIPSRLVWLCLLARARNGD